MGIEPVEAVFRGVFGDDMPKLTPETTARDVPEWDSFAHINLIVALEEAFAVSFTSEEMAGMGCVGDLVTILRSHGVAVDWSN